MTPGIISGWLLAALSLSFYARKRIGAARWRSLHRWTALVWLMSIVHAFGQGTDAGETWFLLLVGTFVVPPLALLVLRLDGLRSSRTPAPQP